MLSQTDYNKAHKEYPFADEYPNTPDKCYHDYSFVVFCNGQTDIVRCKKCGHEIEQRCNFDDDYN